MKIYVFDGIYGVVARYACNSISKAEAWFKRTYPDRTYACIYEQ